jgi:hypothetical protein
LILDDDEATAMGCYQLLSKLKKHPEAPTVRNRVSSICFVDDSQYPGVQAADMVTYESRKFMVDRIANSNVEPSELWKTLTRPDSQPHLFDGPALDELERVT